MNKYIVHIFFLFLLTGYCYSQTDKYVSFYKLCRINGYAVKFNLNLSYVDVSSGTNTLKLYLTMPYLVSAGKIYYFSRIAAFNQTGELEIPSETSDLIRKILGNAASGEGKFINPEPLVSKNNKFSSIPEIQASANANSNATMISKDISSSVISSKSDQNLKKDYNIIETNKQPVFNPGKDDYVPINAIVIDPGHGGKDPGGLGINGIKEKEIVLSVSRYLYGLLKNNGKIKVIFTRRDDRYVTLKERTDLCAQLLKKNYNPIFISIHGNISLSRNIDGIEVYSLSDKASDEEALSVEIVENAGFSKKDVMKTEELYSIIHDLLKDGIRRQSEELASNIANSITEETGAHLRGVKNANFYVLKYNSLPSVLVEVGFLSNPAESRSMMEKGYQKKIAVGLYDGIMKFLDNYNESRGFTR